MTHRCPSGCKRTNGRVAAIQFVALLAALGTSVCANAVSIPTANVTVDANSVLNTVPKYPFGVNTAVWDGFLTDNNTLPLLQAAGIRMLRYPGGSASDSYHWESNENIAPNDTFTWNSNASFDPFMTTISKPLGAAELITVNYGSNSSLTGGGDPQEAAAWVKYANITKHYNVKYWEIGNEVYGNGYYATFWDWETDFHDLDQNANDRVGNANLGPVTYGQNVAAYSNAMKAVDPTIKIGVVLSLPGGQPGLASGNLLDWNSNVLKQCGTKIDFVIVHWYPEDGNDSDPVLLSDPSQIAAFMSGLKADIAQYCGSNAPNVQVFVTELNSDPGNPGKQMLSVVNAMFVSNTIQTFLENGASNIDYWDLRNGAGNGDDDPSLFGTLQYGDEGILSNGSSTFVNNAVVTEPAVDTPFSTYYGLEMTHFLTQPQDTMVSSTSTQPLLVAHAVKHLNGSLGILLANNSPSTNFAVNLNVSNFSMPATETTSTFGPALQVVTSTTGPTQSQVLIPPYTMVEINTTPPPSSVPTNTFSPGLQMISFPYDFSALDESLVLSPVTPMAAWDTATGQYSLPPDAPADSYRAGQGYWVRVPAQGASITAPTGVAPGPNTAVSLLTGWNMIGDPYNETLPVSKMQITVSPAAPISLAQAAANNVIGPNLFSFNSGSFGYSAISTTTGSIEPYSGYWIYAAEPCTITFNQ